jgi:hypothetical protein
MKLFAIGVSFIVTSVIFMGAGTVSSINYDWVNDNEIGMESNVSFIAPMPINVSSAAYLLPHEIYIGTPEFFVAMEGK